MENNNRIFIILVLFQRTLQGSQSFQSLKRFVKNLSLDYKIVLYNNSPDIDIPLDTDFDYTVITASRNDMLAGPYNKAWEMAKNEGYQWILLLDQDSELTADYFKKISLQISTTKGNVAAIVPTTKSKNIHISPCEFLNFAGPFWCIKPHSGQLSPSRYVNGINSCTVVRTEAITAINGFSVEFPLDYLDCWMFYQFHKKSFLIETIDVVIEHHLSILSIDDMEIERYKQYMHSCAKFAHLTQNSFLWAFRTRSAIRCAKQLFIPKRWRLLKPTFTAIFE